MSKYDISDKRIEELMQADADLTELKDNVAEALGVAADFGQTDGAHHKMWVIDRMVASLLGTDERYNDWVAAEQHGDDGPETYEWDRGIAP
jgi:hypothetical protein